MREICFLEICLHAEDKNGDGAFGGNEAGDGEEDGYLGDEDDFW